MTKTLLALFTILALTACHERQGPEPTTSKFTEQVFISSVSDTTHKDVPMKEKGISETVVTKRESSEALVEDIPILEDDLPVLPTPVMAEERTSAPKALQTSTQTFRGGKRSDGLDIKTIRSSQNAIRTRLVFDSYNSQGKATQSGHYTFVYNPSKKKIVATVNGYRNFSAMGSNKTRTFPSNSIIKNIQMEKYLDDSGFKFSINLHKASSVNVFELKSPARIVVDITPN